MTCNENSEEEKYENGDEENKQESKNLEDDERKVDPETARNTEEPKGIPLTQLYISNIFRTGIKNEWVMSMIEHKLATPRVPSLSSMDRILKPWRRREKSKYDQRTAGLREINDQTQEQQCLMSS